MRAERWATVGMLAALVLAGGCATRLCRYDIRVKADPDLTKLNGKYPPVEVNLVVLDTAESGLMARRSMTDYWRPGRQTDIQDSQKKQLFFGEEKGISDVFANSDPKWLTWKKIEEPRLWILADLPGTYADGDSDPRRVSVPLDRTRCWFRKVHKIDVVFGRGGISAKDPDLDAAKGKK